MTYPGRAVPAPELSSLPGGKRENKTKNKKKRKNFIFFFAVLMLLCKWEWVWLFHRRYLGWERLWQRLGALLIPSEQACAHGVCFVAPLLFWGLLQPPPSISVFLPGVGFAGGERSVGLVLGVSAPLCL